MVTTCSNLFSEPKGSQNPVFLHTGLFVLPYSALIPLLLFEGVDWFALQRKEVEPPFLPLVESWERGGGGGGEGSARTNLGGASFGSNASDSTSRDYGGHSTSTDNWFSGSNCTSHESIGDGNDARRSEGGGSGSGSGKHWKSSKWDTGGDERCDDLFGSLFGDWTWISL
eukprot:TRINITY_DN3379_c0_g1_i3.p2 TRINITY_DN3379_c0_g1~~TRINITY_DN3379_c0_g1_i3.p2  ORF type:complete len:170 (+),score=41.17 TRINITY_DN3379_c0_g1_i3:809-1318(+)